MKYPTLEYVLNNNNDYYDMLIDCIDFIETNEEIIHSRDVSRDSMKEFVENLSKNDFNVLIDFFKTMPKIEKEIKYKTSDAVERTIILKGLRDFFQ
jgi:hypothetical protein